MQLPLRAEQAADVRLLLFAPLLRIVGERRVRCAVDHPSLALVEVRLACSDPRSLGLRTVQQLVAAVRERFQLRHERGPLQLQLFDPIGQLSQCLS